MAKRKFQLPGIQDLSKEQEAVRALPKEGRHLIIGGPGTGKSVLALIRARRHHGDGDSYRFLVFNHLLDRANYQLFGSGLESKTWDRWFRVLFRELASQPIPVQEQENGYRGIDWASVEAIIRDLPRDEETPQRPFLVIDEGQDMPPQFYESLMEFGFDRFFVVADQNQQIKAANSNIQDIRDRLVIEQREVIELRQNYRNAYPVARLVHEFWTKDPATHPPELPRGRPGPAPLLYVYDESELDRVSSGILGLADRSPQHLIGVIAPNNRVRERYLQALESCDVRLDNPRPAIRTFHGENRSAVPFDEGGILVINAQACKGLEFDQVALVDIDEHFVRRNDPDVAKRLFYVMVARARERVFMFMRRGRGREIEKILPSDQDVLRRKTL